MLKIGGDTMFRSRAGHRPALALTAAALLVLSPAGSSAEEPESGQVASDTVTIKVVDFAFEPATVTVRPGDVVRFVNTNFTAHNVEFTKTPAETKLGEEYVVPVEQIGTRAVIFPPPRIGPYLTDEGEAYEFVITDAFAAGEYRYGCTPHGSMGMKGKLIVEKPPEAEE